MKLISAIGLMSGTSMDSIDGTLILTNGKDVTKNHFSMSSHYQPRTLDLLDKFIKKIPNLDKTHSDWKILNELVALDHGSLIKDIIANSNVKPDIIGFHGQTIYHNSKKKISIQVGYPQFIKNIFGITTVSDFRSNDFLTGGEGAPLAPIYHKSIIEKLKINLPACFINIGGVSNLTYWDGKELIGFDTGPGNGLMDRHTKKHLNKQYDEDGFFASQGKISSDLVKTFMKNKYFSDKYPKSLDNLYFSKFMENNDFNRLSVCDALATLSYITINTILESIKMLPKLPKIIVIMGGGQYNINLINKLKENTSIKVLTSKQLNLKAKMIEPELIGYLAVRRILNLPSTFPSTTGVDFPTICGRIY